MHLSILGALRIFIIFPLKLRPDGLVHTCSQSAVHEVALKTVF